MGEDTDQVELSLQIGGKTSVAELLKEQSSIGIKKILSRKITDQVNRIRLQGLTDSKIIEDTLKLFKDRKAEIVKQERQRTDQQSYLHMMSILNHNRNDRSQTTINSESSYSYLPKIRSEALELIKMAAKPDARVQMSPKEMRKSPFFQRIKRNRRTNTENDAVTLFKTG